MARCVRAARTTLSLLLLGDEALLGVAEVAGGVAQNVGHGVPDIEDAEEVEHHAQEVRRAHDGDLGSRPTMIVSVWWRAWLQRQVTGLRMISEAGDLVDDIVHPARPKAVPWPPSCQRESLDEP